ncbi:hypothetical protein vseg_006925 [Gypsophila vaccaria]
MFRGERHQMKLKDKSLEIERHKERSEASQNDYSPTQIIHHFSHTHPLSYVQPDYAAFSCNSCAGRGRGKRYHCSLCRFDLHEVCARTPVTWLLHHMARGEMEVFGGVRRDVVASTFAHPDHVLATEYMRRSYSCGHCKNSGNGLRFQCHACDGGDVEFDQVCVKNPTRLTTYVHPEHELELMLRPHFKTCDLCGTSGPSNNRMYKCKRCDFYVHPGCTQWPLYLIHPLHPPHPIMLNPCGSYIHRCSACRGFARRYKYSCKLCGLDFDLKCILKHSKFGQGEELRQKYASHHQEMSVMPVTNLALPDISQIFIDASVASSGGGIPQGVPAMVRDIAELATAMATSE